MPKKSRRTKSKYHTKSAKETSAKRPQQVKTAVAKPEPVTKMAASEPQSGIKTAADRSRSIARPASGAQNHVSSYDYVIPELKHIGILTGSIIAILIILSFIL